MSETVTEKEAWRPWANFKPLERGTSADIIRSIQALNKKVAAQKKKLSRFFA